jgi:hypothetical protein
MACCLAWHIPETAGSQEAEGTQGNKTSDHGAVPWTLWLLQVELDARLQWVKHMPSVKKLKVINLNNIHISCYMPGMAN